MNSWFGLRGVRGAAAAAHLSFADDAKGVIKLFDMRRRKKKEKRKKRKKEREKSGEEKERRKESGRKELQRGHITGNYEENLHSRLNAYRVVSGLAT